MKNAASWFEIPTRNLDRAQKFYEFILGIEFQIFDLPNIKMRIFPIEDPQSGIGGALVDSGGFHQPSKTDGPLIYLYANPNVQAVLDKVKKAGGEVLVPKTPVSDDFGYMAVIIDSEGNRIALHSVD
jgi:predicted enzyme related to lactoylglutathione lyase